MTGYLEIVRHVLLKVSHVPDAQILPLVPYVQRKELLAGAFALRAGDWATHVFIVESGLLREYYLDREGRQATRSFSCEGSLSGSLADLLSGAPAVTYLEALEPTFVLSIPWAAIESTAQADMHWQILLRRIAERLYVQKVNREHTLLTLTAVERLALFKSSYPALWSRVPKHAIASYLGITPVHLSRLSSAGQ
jgi:CRP-like cAMP-binding protein